MPTNPVAPVMSTGPSSCGLRVMPSGGVMRPPQHGRRHRAATRRRHPWSGATRAAGCPALQAGSRCRRVGAHRHRGPCNSQPQTVPPNRGVAPVSRPLVRSGQQAEPLRALHCLGAVAHVELAIQRARVLLDRVRREVELAPRSRGSSHPPAIRASTSRSRLGERGLRARRRGLVEERDPERDHPHGARDVRGRPVLRDEAAGPARGAPSRRRSGRRRRSAARAAPARSVNRRSQTSGPDSRAEEEVDERDVGGVAAREVERLVAGARRQAALDPRRARRA